MNKRRVLSIVTPIYNEERNVLLFYKTLVETLKKLPYQFEVILVDDGSTDNSAEAVKRLKPKANVDPVPVFLSRNFGKEIAVTAGLAQAAGDAVIVLDSDLQHPIDKIPEFIEKWKSGVDVVIGVRATSAHADVVRSVGSKLFYRIINKISETNIIPHSTDYRLLDRAVVDEFNKFTERNRITRGLIDWLGFERDIVEFDTNERQHGEPSYKLSKLIGLGVCSFVSHSLFPLRIVGYFGVLMSLVSASLGAFIIIEQFVLGDPWGLQVSGTAMVTVAVLFVCGVILVSLGTISLYLATIHTETLNRPLYVTRQRDRE